MRNALQPLETCPRRLAEERWADGRELGVQVG